MKHLLAAAFFLISSCTPKGSLPAPKTPAVDMEQFLYWCIPEGDGVWQVASEEPAACKPERVSRGEWASLPISINATAGLEDDTRDAVASFNAQIGFELFAYDHANYEPDVIVVSADFHPYAAAMASHTTLDGRHRGLVQFFNGVKGRADIVAHELGHIVGLRHDHGNRMSIMYPGPTTRVAMFEERDLRALRARYRTLIGIP